MNWEGARRAERAVPVTCLSRVTFSAIRNSGHEGG